MDVTKPFEFIGFGAMHEEFGIRIGADRGEPSAGSTPKSRLGEAWPESGGTSTDQAAYAPLS